MKAKSSKSGGLRIALFLMMLIVATTMSAQRHTDRLDRGLVAIPANSNGGSGSGNFISWRIFAEEYYDVTYNLYCNGKLLKEGLTVSNFCHTAGNATSKYQVAAVVRGVEQERCAEVTRWNNGYLDIPAKPVLDRNGKDVTTSQGYILNDVSLGDVDGDGITEFIVKRNNSKDLRLTANKVAYNFYECYNIKGERLWTIDLGPNLMAGADEQWDLVLYDWDEDGKCELLMRGADNMIIHAADGSTINVGNMKVDTRWNDIAYTNQGAEYLLYMEGATAKPYNLKDRSTWDKATNTYAYQPIDYPLPRYDVGETADLLGESAEGAIWGSGIKGHRPTKHFFGAPFLDGRHASIFLGRGIYTREKMIALDVNRTTHELTERWRWHCYDSNSPWFGQGYHNYAIADVDWDGRDEIVYGSMVIDDNGKGLSTTGLGHGDAQHCGDFDPYRHGQEQFACLEHHPCMNYRNATTGEIYYRWVGSGDDGRALCGNFSNAFPGATGATIGSSGMVSCVADKVNTEIGFGISLNSRIYWDGDLLDELLDSPGTEKDAAVTKPGGGRIFMSVNCNMNNWSKNNACATGDIFGDWREEIVLRTNGSTALRIYTTPHPTRHRLYTLWHDHQYRQAMVWECLGYNQPPHVSYFVGELEGITMAPPPLTNTGRTEINNGSVINSSLNGEHVMLCDQADATISVSEGAQPYIFTDNAPSWVQGTDINGTSTLNNRSEIIYKYYTHTVTGAAFSGDMRLVKQGDGTLVLPKVVQTYTGSTDIWAGTLQFDGTLLNSPLWLNRFACLNSDGGEFKCIKMDYDAKLRPGGEGKIGNVKTKTLEMGFGSRIVFDIDGETADHVTATTLSIEKKNWEYGPKYLTPVFEFKNAENIADGRYLLATVDTIIGSIDDIIIEGIPVTQKATLSYEEGNVYLTVLSLREAKAIVWTGNNGTTWDFAKTENFAAENGQSEVFVVGDKVYFDETAAQTTVNLIGDLQAGSIFVEGTKNFTVDGRGSIMGNGALVKTNTGTLTINTDNGFTGGVRLSGGITTIKSLANSNQARGALGAMTTKPEEFIMENGAELRTTHVVRQESPMMMQSSEGGVLNKQAGFSMAAPFSGTKLTVKGSGFLQISAASPKLDTLCIKAGSYELLGHNLPAKAVVLEGGTLRPGGLYITSSYPIIVPKGKTGTYSLAERCSYTHTVKGEGTLNVECPPTNGGAARTAFGANLAQFEGTLKTVGTNNWGFFIFDNSSAMQKGTLQIADNVEVKNSGKTMTFGCVKGDKGKLGGFEAAGARISEAPNTWRIGNETNWTWSGTVTSNSNLVKVGTGKVTLNGTSDHTGTTTVNEGELHFGNKATLGKGTLTVKKGAILSGATNAKGNLTNSAYNIQNGGTLQVGSYATATTGVINFGNKNVTFAKGSVLQLGIGRAATAISTGGTSLGNIKRLTMNGIIQFHYSKSFAPAEGDSVVLWKATTFAGTPVLENDTIDAEKCLFWDTTHLKDGILRVIKKTPTAIRNIQMDESSDAVYDLMGHKVADALTPSLRRGIYIHKNKKIIIR